MSALDLEHIRPVLESEIERLIDMLDTLDEDPDLESTGDEEPWLGAPGECTAMATARIGTEWSAGDDREDDGDDREEVCEDEGAQCDDEGVIDGDQESNVG